MALTFKEIWSRYPQFEMRRQMYVKRLRRDGAYEDDWQEISQGMMQDGSINRIQRSLPNSSYQFGKLQVANANMRIMSAYREFADESVPGSIFRNFVRHWSKIKVVDSIVDKYTDPDNCSDISVTSFQGLIDAKTATTEQNYESFTALDFITVLDQVSVSALTLTKTTLSELVYEIMNRSEFTNYFNVSSAATYIDPGYDATSIDTSEYDGSVLEMLQDLAKGHSIFYIDTDDSYFYFKEALPTDDVQFSFLEKNNRKLSISRYREGKDRQITKWYWEDTDPVISAIASATTPITENFSIQGVTSAAQRQATLNFVLGKTSSAKAYFNLELPFFPIIKILDKVIVQSYGSAPLNAIRWGMFIWTDTDTGSPSVAPRWTKATGIKISSSTRWMVRGITHDKNLKTTLELEATS